MQKKVCVKRSKQKLYKMSKIRHKCKTNKKYNWNL